MAYGQGFSYAPQGNWSYAKAPYRANRYGVAQRKHSGCRVKNIDGVSVVYGWNYSRSRGMITAYARPYNKTKEVRSKNGRTWLNYFVTITNKKTMQVTKTSGLFDPQRNRVYIQDFNLLMSANTNYFGTHIRKRR